MKDRYSRFVPLTGALFAVLAILALVTGPGETPEGDERPLKVFHFYSSHASEVETSGILFTIAFLAFVLFAGTLRAYMRRTAGVESLATLTLAGAVVITAGAGVGGGIEFGLGQNIDHVTPQVAQTLNLASQGAFFPAIVGGFVYALSSGLAILRGAALPRWLGWVAIVMAIAFVVPPAFIVAFALIILWSLAVAVLMFLRWDGGEQLAAPAPA
jgi:hypothetical protein